MANTVTATGKTSGAFTATAKTVTPLSQLTFDFAEGVLRRYTGGGNNAGTLAFDMGLDSVTTVTCTVSGGNFAFTVS